MRGRLVAACSLLAAGRAGSLGCAIRTATAFIFEFGISFHRPSSLAKPARAPAAPTCFWSAAQRALPPTHPEPHSMGAIISRSSKRQAAASSKEAAAAPKPGALQAAHGVLHPLALPAQ